MLETYFTAPKALGRLRGGPSGPYVDGFAASLEAEGYAHATAVRYLRAAAHLGHYLQQQGETLADIDPSTPAAFFRHLATCRCPYPSRGHQNHHPYFGARRFRDYLEQLGVCRRDASDLRTPEPTLIVGFQQWLRKHRGVTDATIRNYSRRAVELLVALGDDSARWQARGIRGYFVHRVTGCGIATAEHLVTSLRAFLRYLSVHGHCSADLDKAVPTFACWRLAELPKCLTAEQVERLIAACDGDEPGRRRDRAIILLLARLGLRSGDVARLRIGDIEWKSGTLRVAGKGRYQVRLPLPQEVGDAIVGYLECRPRGLDCDHVFVRSIAPFGKFVSGDGVSCVARRAMKRAGVTASAKGAHALRHTAATQMLRHGVPLDQIALVLRHRGIDTTAYYAKADAGLLKQIAQRWPEMLS